MRESGGSIKTSGASASKGIRLRRYRDIMHVPLTPVRQRTVVPSHYCSQHITLDASEKCPTRSWVQDRFLAIFVPIMKLRIQGSWTR